MQNRHSQEHQGRKGQDGNRRLGEMENIYPRRSGGERAAFSIWVQAIRARTMRGRKARYELIPSEDDYHHKPEERPRILSSEYRHNNRKIEPRKHSSSGET